jgi:hypothetical protein
VSLTERRHARRFELQSPVIIRWKHGSEMREALTVSEDISSNGLYFILPEGIQNGTPVEVEMTLPNQVTLAGPVRVRCQGHIQRCEPKEGATTGMAAAIEKYEFLPGGSEPSSEKDSPSRSGG